MTQILLRFAAAVVIYAAICAAACAAAIARARRADRALPDDEEPDMTTPDFTLEYCAAKQQPHTIPLGAVFTFKGSGETFVCLPCGVTCEDCAFDSTNKRGKKHAAAVKGCRSFACVPSMRLDGQRTKAVTLSKLRQLLPY